MSSDNYNLASFAGRYDNCEFWVTKYFKLINFYE